ncbi:MAG TPA: EamA family transporter [Candidatus Limnocylindria bacterium]|jgi:drug/metabolite transporter (DMT)-like permease|nr:EamA family transporter [Candidatus Limnocylindria bacterium]
MTKLVLVLLVGLVLEAIGVVFLSRGLKVIGEMQQVSVSEILRMVVAGASNRHILLGVAFEAAFFGCLLYLMSHGEVSFVWPLTSLGFVLTTIAARFWLHETVVPLRWFGVFLIVLGAGIITYTEKYKKPEAAAATSMAAPAEK